jgi:ribosomal protection tetracycline resistance protein
VFQSSVHLLNLGILAHVDAGKTSLTERLLFAAGAISELGRVDDGSTQTDSLALERQRGITIKAAVVSFTAGDLTINLIDTPGHPDFIAEVERALGVLDGAVLVVSAVEGVQAQTRVLMRALQRLRIPTAIFVNKIDRSGAAYDRTLADIAARLSPAIVAMGNVQDLGTRRAQWRPYGPGDADFATNLTDLLALGDDALLAAFVTDSRALSYLRLRSALAAQTAQALPAAAHGVGESPTGGDGAVRAPAIRNRTAAGRVFKIERGPAGEKIAYVRMFAGALRAREHLRYGADRVARVTAVRVFNGGPAAPAESVVAGQIAKVWGLSDVRVGDHVGAARMTEPGHSFAPPTLETVVVPGRPADRPAVHAALTQLAEQDPLINLRQDDVRQEILVSLYGEVQKEVIQATLADEYGVNVGFRETTTICIERVAGEGAAVEYMGSDGNPFKATVGLRVGPAPERSGVQFRLEIERGSLPPAFLKAVEETARRTLAEGLRGWPVPDCVVTMTHSGYVPPPPYGWSKYSSSAGDFRLLTPLVLMTALARARTLVWEPVSTFRLEVPHDSLSPVLTLLGRLGAVSQPPAGHGSASLVEGEILAGRLGELRQQLPGLTGGEGLLDSQFACYRQMQRGEVPVRQRTDHNPLRREEYLLHVQRGVPAR